MKNELIEIERGKLRLKCGVPYHVNIAARIITKSKRDSHIIPIWKHLHWLHYGIRPTHIGIASVSIAQ